MGGRPLFPGLARRGGRVPVVAAVAAVAVAVLAAAVLAAGCTTPREPTERGASSPHTLAEGEFEGGWWRLVATVDQGELTLELRDSRGGRRGVSDYTVPYTLHEAEAWVVPRSSSPDGFTTVVAGPNPEGVRVEVQEHDAGPSARVERVTVAGVPVFVATFDGVARHIQIVGRDGDGREVERHDRQATYTRLQAGSIEGDTWVLDLLSTRQWDRIDVSVGTGGPGRHRLVIWDDGYVEYRTSGQAAAARFGRVSVHRGADGGIRITDGRFAPCAPAVPAPFEQGAAAPLLAPWTELEWLEPRIASVEVVGEQVVQGRRALDVILKEGLYEEQAEHGMAPQSQRWLVDAATGVVVASGPTGHEPPPMLEIHAVDDDVTAPTLDKLTLPRGQVSYERQLASGGGGAPSQSSVVSREVLESDGGLTLGAALAHFEPDGLDQVACAGDPASAGAGSFAP